MKPFLSLRKNGIWYVVDERPDGKRTWTTTKQKNRRAAERVLIEYENRMQTRDDAPFLTHFTDEILQYTEATFARKTMKLYRDALRALTDHVGDIPISMITTRDVDRYKSARVRRVKPITVNKELSTLKAAFNTAIRWGYIEANPFVGVTRLRIPESPPAFFTRDEFRRVEEETRGHWLHDLIVMAVSTGMRAGELTNLTWPHVDLDRRVLRVANSATFQTKTGRSRIIPLNAHACLLLAERRERGEAYVLTMRGRQIGKNWISSAFKKVIRRLDMREELHFHSLRHTFASWLVQDGVSLYQVGRLLGHSTARTTEVYAHLQPETMHDVVDRLTLSD